MGKVLNDLGEKKSYRETLHQLLSLKDALEVMHVPYASEAVNGGRRDQPSQDLRVGALACQTEAFILGRHQP